MRLLAFVAVVLVAASLAGCGEQVTGRDFVLTPARIGWNVTEVASFTLEIQPGRGAQAPSYTVDPVFAIQALDLDTGGVGGDFRTDRPEDLGLELVAGNRTVPEHRLVPGEPVTVRFRLPEGLKDDAYTLTLVLFQAGEVESAPFRVNRP